MALRHGWAELRRAPWLEPAQLVALAAAVGVAGGLGASVFRWLIQAFRLFFVQFLLGPGAGWSPAVAAHVRYLAPTVGFVLVGVITTYLAAEVKGHGVPQILEALALRGGRIRPRVALFGILAPAITIGAEGSVGREGPIALIGASFGSVIGQLLHLAERQTSLLLACGAAAGIAATFDAPVAGALFGLEVVLGSYAMGALVPCFVAAVTGVTVFDWLHGPALALPSPRSASCIRSASSSCSRWACWLGRSPSHTPAA
jgi:CIC family chloride channel protein